MSTSSKTAQVARATGLIILITLLSKITGFGRTVALADVFGSSCLTDSFVAASVFPMILFAGIDGAIGTTFIPLYTEIRESQGQTAGWDYTNQVFSALMIALLLVEAAGLLLALPMLHVLVPGFVGRSCGGMPEIQLTLRLTWVMLPALIFMGASGVQGGLLQAENRFGPPAAVGIPQNLIIIAAIYGLSSRVGIYAAAIGTLVGGCSFLAVQGIPLHRLGFRHRWLWGGKNPFLRRMGRLVLPVFLATFASQGGLIVDRILASRLANGSISALNYASLINNVMLGIFVSALVTAVYPLLARYAANRDGFGFMEAVRRAMGMLVVVTLPIAVGIILLRVPLVRGIYQHGAFTSRDTANTATALAFFAVGLVPGAAATLLPRAFFAMQDTRTPALFGLFAVAVNIVADLLLVGPLAQGGLALGTSIAQFAQAGMLLWLLRRRVGKLGGSRLLQTLLKTALAAGVMGMVVEALARLMPKPLGLWTVLNLGIWLVVGAATYLGLARLLRVEEIQDLEDLFRRAWRQLRARDVIHP